LNFKSPGTEFSIYDSSAIAKTPPCHFSQSEYITTRSERALDRLRHEQSALYWCSTPLSLLCSPFSIGHLRVNVA